MLCLPNRASSLRHTCNRSFIMSVGDRRAQLEVRGMVRRAAAACASGEEEEVEEEEEEGAGERTCGPKTPSMRY